MVTRRGSTSARLGLSAFAALMLSGCGGTNDAVSFTARSADQTQRTNLATGDAPDRYGFGQPAIRAEIEAWDIDVMPDGTGLPPGEGTAETGATVYARQCASCHGPEGEGGSGEALVGVIPGGGAPFGTTYEDWRGDRNDVPFTVGNYWPYATTLFDYINRAMPSSAPGSLNTDQVYGLVAWLLVKNEIIPEDSVMNAETLPKVAMPARDLFVPDNRHGGPEVK